MRSARVQVYASNAFLIVSVYWDLLSITTTCTVIFSHLKPLGLKNLIPSTLFFTHSIVISKEDFYIFPYICFCVGLWTLFGPQYCFWGHGFNYSKFTLSMNVFIVILQIVALLFFKRGFLNISLHTHSMFYFKHYVG